VLEHLISNKSQASAVASLESLISQNDLAGYLGVFLLDCEDRGLSQNTLIDYRDKIGAFIDYYRGAGIDVFKDIEMLLAFPEYKVPLLGGPTASQPDIFLLAKGNGQLISVMVEGKKSEPFDAAIA